MGSLSSGVGGEHAIVWGLQRSASAPEVFAAPGNAGIAQTALCFPVDQHDPPRSRSSPTTSSRLVVVAADRQLVNGVADAVRARGILAFGPDADGARLEGSKTWMKEVLAEAGVPTARYGSFRDEAAAFAFLDALRAAVRGEDRRTRGGEGRARHRVRSTPRTTRCGPTSRARRSVTPAARS